MRKVAVVFLVLGFVTVLSMGVSSVQAQISYSDTSGALIIPDEIEDGVLEGVPGTWDLVVDWFCDGSTISSTWTLSKSHTFVSGDGFHGIWNKKKKSITLTYSNSTKYSGKITAKNLMSGTIVDFNGNPGCWSAHKH